MRFVALPAIVNSVGFTYSERQGKPVNTKENPTPQKEEEQQQPTRPRNSKEAIQIIGRKDPKLVADLLKSILKE